MNKSGNIKLFLVCCPLYGKSCFFKLDPPPQFLSAETVTFAASPPAIYSICTMLANTGWG
jgi:hypothetical protein